MIELIQDYLAQDNHLTAAPIFITTGEYPRAFLLASEAEEYAKNRGVSFHICSLPPGSSIRYLLYQAVNNLRSQLTPQELDQARNLLIL